MLKSEDFAVRNCGPFGDVVPDDMIFMDEKKEVRYGTYRNGDGLVCKVMTRQAGNSDLLVEVSHAEHALKYLAAFHAEMDATCPSLGDNLCMRLHMPAVWSKHGPMGRVQKFLVQPYVEDPVLLNSNTGWANEEAEMAQALSHFSFHHSNGTRLLCQLKGEWEWEGDHRYNLTGATLMSNGAAGTLGDEDLGAKGVENFFAHHVCNHFCSQSWMKWVNPQAHYEADEYSPLTCGEAY